jgi:hypothetical protein
MRKYLPYLLILVVISVIVVLAVANSVPNVGQAETKSDPLSCQCQIKSDLKLIAKGIITDTKDIQSESSSSVQFKVDGLPMVLDYGKTAGIFNKTGAGGIVEGEYYYIYDWDGMRIIWSQTPKTLDNTGHIADPQ